MTPFPAGILNQFFAQSLLMLFPVDSFYLVIKAEEWPFCWACFTSLAMQWLA